MKILLAVDGSEYSRRMLDYIAVHSKSFGDSSFTAAFTVPQVARRAIAMVGVHAARDYYAEEANAVLDPIRQLLADHGVQAECVFRVGQPAAEIASLAESEHFDLLVMGSHGHNALKNLVLGSVATQLLAACKVPVVIVL
mgnify:CR=1 FL=1